MSKISIKDKSGAACGEMELNEAVFGVEPNANVVRAALDAFLANQRQGTAQAKTRGEVSGGGRKPWKQKGTGRARQGSIRSPIWRGGAVIFGPRPRSYRVKVNSKVRRNAIRSILSERASTGAVAVVESLDLDAIQTRQVVNLLGTLGLAGRVLIVTPELNENLVLSARNLPNVEVAPPENLNVYTLLTHDRLLFSRASIERVAEIYA